jgi:hypothetical protein
VEVGVCACGAPAPVNAATITTHIAGQSSCDLLDRRETLARRRQGCALIYIGVRVDKTGFDVCGRTRRLWRLRR